MSWELIQKVKGSWCITEGHTFGMSNKIHRIFGVCDQTPTKLRNFLF